MILVLSSVVIGVILGYFFKTLAFIDINVLIQFGLYFLLFVIGIDLGRNNSILKSLKQLDKKILFLPFIVIVASLIGGALASLFIDMNIKESVAISSGMGWYSFSAIELTKVSAELGGVAFLSNVFREVLAIIFIPLISNKIGSLEAVAIGGATSMDSVLPIINKYNSNRVSIISVYSGLIISLIVPLLVPTLVKIFAL